MTRPAPASEAFLAGLDLRGVDVCISPLMEIEPVGALPDMAGYDALVFTSANGVRAYHAAGGGPIPAYCVGDSTAQVAGDLLGSMVVSAGADADALVTLIREQAAPGARLLHVRGRHARGAVAARLTAANIPTDEVVLYDQVSHPLSAEARELLSSGALAIVPLFSPRSAALFLADLPRGARIRAIAMSPAVDKALPSHMFDSVKVAAAPTLDAVRNAVADALNASGPLEGDRGNS